MQILVNFEIFKLLLNLSLSIITWLKSHFYSWQAIWALKCIKERFNERLKISKFTRNCMENHSSVTRWQELFSAAFTIASFEIYGWKFTGYLVLICSFSLCYQNFLKANYFRVYRKLITWLTIAKGPWARPGGPCPPRGGLGACFPRKVLNSIVAEMWFPAFWSCSQKR